MLLCLFCCLFVSSEHKGGGTISVTRLRFSGPAAQITGSVTAGAITSDVTLLIGAVLSLSGPSISLPKITMSGGDQIFVGSGSTVTISEVWSTATSVVSSNGDLTVSGGSLSATWRGGGMITVSGAVGGNFNAYVSQLRANGVTCSGTLNLVSGCSLSFSGGGWVGGTLTLNGGVINSGGTFNPTTCQLVNGTLQARSWTTCTTTTGPTIGNRLTFGSGTTRFNSMNAFPGILDVGSATVIVANAPTAISGTLIVTTGFLNLTGSAISPARFVCNSPGGGNFLVNGNMPTTATFTGAGLCGVYGFRVNDYISFPEGWSIPGPVTVTATQLSVTGSAVSGPLTVSGGVLALFGTTTVTGALTILAGGQVSVSGGNVVVSGGTTSLLGVLVINDGVVRDKPLSGFASGGQINGIGGLLSAPIPAMAGVMIVTAATVSSNITSMAGSITYNAGATFTGNIAIV